MNDQISARIIDALSRLENLQPTLLSKSFTLPYCGLNIPVRHRKETIGSKFINQVLTIIQADKGWIRIYPDGVVLTGGNIHEEGPQKKIPSLIIARVDIAALNNGAFDIDSLIELIGSESDRNNPALVVHRLTYNPKCIQAVVVERVYLHYVSLTRTGALNGPAVTTVNMTNDQLEVPSFIWSPKPKVIPAYGLANPVVMWFVGYNAPNGYHYFPYYFSKREEMEEIIRWIGTTELDSMNPYGFVKSTDHLRFIMMINDLLE